MQFVGEERDPALARAYLCYRQAIAELPTVAERYSNLGLVYREVGENSLAKAYLRRAVEFDKAHSHVNHMLGNILSEEGDKIGAKQAWLNGMRDTDARYPRLRSKSACVADYSGAMLEEGRYDEAAYCAKWALDLPHDEERTTPLRMALQRCLDRVSEAQCKALAGKTDGFSTAGLLEYVALKGTEKKPVGGTKPLEFRTGCSEELARKVAQGSTMPYEKGLTKALPEEPFEICPALGGAYLVMHFKTTKKLGVFNVPHAKFDFFISLEDDDILFTAGGDMLLLYQSGQREFEVWDLTKFERRATRACRIDGVVTQLEMALDNPGRCIIGYCDSMDEWVEVRYALFDVSTFTTKPIMEGPWITGNSYGDKVNIRWEDTGTCAARWVSWQNNQRLDLARFDNGTSKKDKHFGRSFGPLLPADGGKRVYGMTGPGGGGTIFNGEGDALGKRHSAALCPVRGAELYLAIEQTNVAVCDATSGEEFRTFEIPYTIKVPRRGPEGKLTADRTVFANSWIHRVCFIYPEQMVATIYPLNVSAGTGGELKVLSGVKPGTTWRRRLQFPADARVRVELAPPGVSWDAATQELTWNVPPDQEAGKAKILLNVVTKGGDQYERIEVTVSGGR